MKIVVVGAGGRLGAALVQSWQDEFDVKGFTHAQLNLAASENLGATLEPLDFDALVNAAALTNVDYCETHRAEAMQLNAVAPRLLAEICAAKGARFIHVSTDYVFDGGKRAPYAEEDTARPISIYGESKRAGEEEVLAAYANALVVRVSWIFGPHRPSFIDAILRKAETEEQVAAVADKFSTPTYTHDLAKWLQPLLVRQIDGGVLHLANSGACSWQQYAQWALDCCHATGRQLRARKVGALSLGEMKNFIARRPAYTVLATEKYARLTNTSLRPWQEAVAEYVREFYAPSSRRRFGAIAR